MDTEFINRIKGYAALFMAVMAAILLVPVDGYSSEREYPDVILDTRLEADAFSGGSLQAVFEKDGWMFYMLDIRDLTDREMACGHILPLAPSYSQYYVRYWDNGRLSMIVECVANLPVGIQTFYDENGNISEQVDYSKKFGKMSPQDILSILEREKVISLSDGRSRKVSTSEFAFFFSLEYDDKTDIWLADINLDFEKEPEANPVSPFYRKYARYSIDGETGRILDVTYETRYEGSEYDEVGAD